MNRIYCTWQADFFERVRRRNYLVILLCMAVLTLVFLPGPNAKYVTLVIGGYRGIYNSAWIGATLAILNGLFLPIISFYLIKNTVEQDREQGVGDLIAATPVVKFEYLTGKWLSNVSLLLGVILLMSVTAIFVQLYYSESFTVNPLELFLPQFIHLFPFLVAISAVAILFETIPLLSRGIGSVLYFFLWKGLISNKVKGEFGTGNIVEQLSQAVILHDPHSTGSTDLGITALANTKQILTFVWPGVTYSSAALITIITMVGVSLFLLGVASFIFDRFKKPKAHGENKTLVKKFQHKLAQLLAPLAKLFENLTNPWSFTRLMRQECLLMLRGGSIWWYLILFGFCLAQLIAPLEMVRVVAVPGTWLLCVLTFSSMGHREIQQGAEQLVFSSLSPIKKQLPAMWLAGFLVALMVVSPALVRFMVSDELFSASMLLSGAVFIPSLALACGALTRTSRTFEFVFLAIWYMGPLDRSPYNFVGVDPVGSQTVGAPLLFSIASIFLIATAFEGRRWQVGS